MIFEKVWPIINCGFIIKLWALSWARLQCFFCYMTILWTFNDFTDNCRYWIVIIVLDFTIVSVLVGIDAHIIHIVSLLVDLLLGTLYLIYLTSILKIHLIYAKFFILGIWSLKCLNDNIRVSFKGILLLTSKTFYETTTSNIF